MFLFIFSSFKIMNQGNRLKQQLFYTTIFPHLCYETKSRYFLVQIYYYWKFSQHSCIVMRIDCLKRADIICFMIFTVQTWMGSTQTNYMCPPKCARVKETPGGMEIQTALRNVFIANNVQLVLCFTVFALRLL